MSNVGAGRTRGAQIYQHVPETRPRGWSCQLIATSHVRYCGISSYTQTIPVGVTEESRRVSLADCTSMIEKKMVTLEDGKTHRIEVPGETRLVVQVAGSEVTANGVMTCHGMGPGGMEVFGRPGPAWRINSVCHHHLFNGEAAVLLCPPPGETLVGWSTEG